MSTTTTTPPAPATLPIQLSKTEALYQKDGTLTTHTTTLTSLTPLSSFPAETQGLFKPIPESSPNDEEHQSQGYILTAPSTIFHAQGGGQPSDTGVIKLSPSTTLPSNEQDKNEHHLPVHQVRKLPSTSTILHLVSLPTSLSPPTPPLPITQTIDAQKRHLHSRLHTAGHVLGLAIHLLTTATPPLLPADLRDGKASHYPSAAFVECFGTAGGVITGDKKSLIQSKVDELVALDLEVRIAWLDREEAGKVCVGGIDGVSLGEEEGEEDGVRVVHIGDLGCYACGGTHVRRLGELGRVVVRGVKRQKGVSKVGYDVV